MGQFGMEISCADQLVYLLTALGKKLCSGLYSKMFRLELFVTCLLAFSQITIGVVHYSFCLI